MSEQSTDTPTNMEEGTGEGVPQNKKIGEEPEPQKTDAIEEPEPQNGDGNNEDSEKIENGVKSENGDIKQKDETIESDESKNDDDAEQAAEEEVNQEVPLDSDPASENGEAETPDDTPATLDMREDFSTVALPVVPTELTEAVTKAHTSETKFAVLKKLSEAVEISDRDLVDTVFNLLVGGEFDLETNFIIKDSECVMYMVDLLESCTLQCQAEIWSKFKGICRKSTRNLHACKEAGLLQSLLIILKDADDMISELLIDMLSLMTSYSITVKELKLLLSMLRGENNTWPARAVQLLRILQQTPERHGPDCFFMFPGIKDAAIALPPLKAWPHSTGFTFSTWFQIEPATTGRVDINKPYLYCFRNSKGLGYSGHFVGNCLIVTFLKAKDKGFQHCVKYEFKPNKWHMVTIVHIYNRWRTSEVKCYANGQLVSTAEMNWCVGANEQFDKCFLGSAETTGDDLRVFSGKMAAVYVFSEALNPSQVYAIYQLGPDYKNQFKFPAESDRLLANHHRKVLYEDSKLSEHLMMAYNPKATDGQLCLESSPRPPNKDGVAHRWFVHSPHALMLHGVKAVVTHSIHCALHSVGGIDVLYPLLSQLNYKQPDGDIDDTVCLTILKFILQLMKGSFKTQQQILQGKGFLVIGYFLEKASKQHITMDVLEILLAISKYLDTLQNNVPLLRQFCDHIFFNPALWIHTDPKVQLSLYTYLSTEFIASSTMQTTVRRVSTVLILMHSLKHYYWVTNPQDRSGVTPKGLDGPRPSKDEILSLRAFILLFLKQLVTRSSGLLDDELQAIMSYLITMNEDENNLDVLQLLVALMSEHSSTVCPVFDNHDGIAVVFKLLGSSSELIRIHSIKLLAYFLQNSSDKRKQELVNTHSLFVLIGERLLLHSDSNTEHPISISTYNALYELLVQEPCTQVLRKPHGEPTANTLIRNPVMMKVIANLLRQFPRENEETMTVRILFLNDLMRLFKNNRDNRRTLLQQSVWQDWMLSSSYLHPQTQNERICQQLVFSLFQILLFHAIKLEWGGWRVWVDTVAIVHSKVTFDAHKAYLENMYNEYKNAEEMSKKLGTVSAITGSIGQSADRTRPESGNGAAVITEVTEDIKIPEQPSLETAQTDAPTEDSPESEEKGQADKESKSEDQNNAQQMEEADQSESTEPGIEDADSGKVPENDGNNDEKEDMASENGDITDEKNDMVSEKGGIDDKKNGTDSENYGTDTEKDGTPDEKDGMASEKHDTNEDAATGDSEQQKEQDQISEDGKVENEDDLGGSDHEQEAEATESEADAMEVEIDVAAEQKLDDDIESEKDGEDAPKIDSDVTKTEDATESETDARKQNDNNQSEGATKSEKLEESPQDATKSEDAATETGQDATKPEEGSSIENKNEVKIEKDKTSDLAREAAVDATASSSEQKPAEESPKKTTKQDKSNEESAIDQATSTVTESAGPSTSTQETEQQGKPVTQQQFSPGPRTSVFRIPEFKWSSFHLRLYNDLFATVEREIQTWKESMLPLVEVVNNSENVIFVHNTIHLVSQTIDNVILACGGILPILSSATSPNYELDTIDSSQGLTMSLAWSMLNRLAAAMDVLAFSTTLNFSEIEQEKNMQPGGILRQCLRTACMCAVRNCLENRYLHHKIPKSAPPTPDVTTDSVELHPVSQNDESNEDADHLSAVEAAEILLSQMSNSATKIADANRLLQDADVTRLRSVIYRDLEESKQAQVLSLAVVYFVSVLMVSKYRDILDPESQMKLLQSIVAKKNLPTGGADKVSGEEGHADIGITEKDIAEALNVHKEGERDRSESSSTEPEESKQSTVQEILKNLAKSEDNNATDSGIVAGRILDKAKGVEQSKFQSFDRSVTVASTPATANAEETPKEQTVPQTVSESAPTDEAEVKTDDKEADHEDLPQINTLEDVNHPVPDADDSLDVSKKLERSLDQLAPLLRDIFLDFSSYLSKVLVGSHGQELLTEGLVCMKSYSSVVELVMLLCSQEWQNSIQKHAGLAFIELINDGRLLCHAMKEHVVRVANEAEFILNKQRAEDVKKHAEFGSWCAVLMTQQRTEERQCDLLISAAKHRDYSSAQSLHNRITNIMTNKHGAWGAVFLSRSREFWKLDSWEDDTRRRRRFVRNPYGSTHAEATLHKQPTPVVVSDAAVSGKFPSTPKAVKISTSDETQPSGTSSDDDDESSLGSIQEKEFEDLNGPATFTTDCDLLAPGLAVQGTFSITTEDIFFEVTETSDSFKKADPKVLQYTEAIHGKWSFHEIRAVFARRYLLQTTAVEVFLANRTSVMFNFPEQATMKKVVNFLPKVGIGTGYGLPQTTRISLASPRQLFKQSNMTQRWQQREISNFEYLMFLNTISGRTYNDLNQYPVFPWVLTNYESAELDLSLPSNFRDMTKPIGALNPKRKTYFESRYEAWEDANIPKFHYGTHYSNAAFTLGWLMRMEPFTSLFLNLQGGKFDHADRTFLSVLQSWKNCQRDSHDVKELIPEFFYLPEIFLNSNNYSLGVNSEKVEIDNIKLPPWADSADDFVKKHRMALESEIVSCQLHQWIDLIFGYKQRGTEAVRATNVFYYLTYENAINLNEITDPIEKMGLKDQIRNFGQTPCQLLAETHPPRSSRMHMTPMMFKDSTSQDVVMVLKFLSNSPVTHVAANTHPSLHNPAVVTCTQNLQFCINKWNQVQGSQAKQNPNDQSKQILPIEPDQLMNTQGALCRRQISDMLDQSVSVLSSCFVVTADNRYLVSCGYWDRSIRIIATDTGKLNQVIFGHWDVVTCLVRSDTYIGGDCYIVSGSRDATLLLWYWNGRRNRIIGDSSSPAENPSPRAVLTGHDTELIAASVCAELGLIASASLNGPVLLHTITGDLLRTLQPSEEALGEKELSLSPYLLKFSSEGIVYVAYKNGLVCNFTMNGRSLTHRKLEDGIKAITLSTDGDYLLTGGDKGILQVWDSWKLKHLYTYPQCDAGIRDIDISHDQKTVITGMTSGSIVAFRIDFNKWHHEFQNKY
ncbi:neurobeachin-like isoform X2 [Styela clava]